MSTAPFYQAFVEVVPESKNLRRTLAREFESAGPSAGRSAGRGVNAGVLGAVGKLAAPLAIAFAALGIGKIVGDAVSSGFDYAKIGVDLASDLAETRSAISQVFGDAGKDIEAYTKTSVKRLGQTQYEALKGAQTFGIFAKAAGLTGPELSDFATDLVGLSADLASFYNTDSQTAIDALGAGLRGESEPLRKFGVLLDDAALKQRAMSMGIYDGKGPLTQQQRVLAAQAEILAQTGIAQGDVERTSGGLAFQQKKLAAGFTEAQTALGTALLPAMTDLMVLANEHLVPILGDVIKTVGPELADALVKSAPAFVELIEALAPLLPDLVELGTELLPVMLDLLIDSAPTLIDMAKNTTTMVGALKAFMELIRGDITMQEYIGKLSSFSGSMADAMNAAIDFSIGVGDSIRSVLDTVAAVGSSMYSAGRDLILNLINGIKSALGAVGDAVGGVMSLIEDYLPHSPAKRGPFSGSGWAAVRDAGLAVGAQFGAGLTASGPSFAGNLSSAVSLPSVSSRIDASVYGSAASAGSSTPGVAVTQNISTIHGQSNAEIAHIAANDLNASLRGF